MISMGKLRFEARLVLCLALAPLLGAISSSAGEVAVIEVHYRRAADLAPIVKSMLSKDGTVTVSGRVNSLIIVDTPQAIQRVKNFLDRFDRPAVQVRIHVRFHTQRAQRESGISARGKISNDNLRAATGGKRKDGLDSTVEESERLLKSDSEFFVPCQR